MRRFAGPAGIPPSIVASFWGIESNYGEKQGDFEVIPALATLVYNNFRASFFRQQLIAALKIVSQGHIALHAMKGSWAGAMGQPQFIPTTFLLYAADGDGDGRYDIWNSKADVFATTVNHLVHIGWKPGLGWGAEVESTAVAGKGERDRAAEWRRRADLPHDREFPGDPALEPIRLLRLGGRNPVGSDRCLTISPRSCIYVAR